MLPHLNVVNSVRPNTVNRFDNNHSMITNSTKENLTKMARITVAICFMFCLYLLIVCVLTHKHTYTQPNQSDQQKESNNNHQAEPWFNMNFNYEPGDPETLFHVEEPALNNANIRQPKSIKLSRLLLKSKNKNDDSKLHRYFVVEKNSDSKPSSKDDSYSDCGYHLAFTLIERDNNKHLYASKLMNKFSNTLTSILLNINSTGLDPGSLCIHLITDNTIRPFLREAIAQIHEELVQKSSHLTNIPHMRHFHQSEQHRPLTRYFFIDSATVEARLEYLLPTLRTFFTHKLDSYYSNALFFYSMVLHQVIPSSIANRLILLDVDVQLNSNILQLFEQFGRFKPDEVIGIAYEQQPVYRHILHEYRRDNPNTTAGSPPPNGFPGFNSGVVLLHLRKMRESKLYNSLLNQMVISHLCQKYRFRGHLGDQDFYTVAAIEHSSLFHVLPCGWNRQLCQWWRFHGYGKVFDDYHRCETPVMLYHGNCNSALPSLTYYGEFKRRRRRR